MSDKKNEQRPLALGAMKVSLVVSVYNEESVLEQFWDCLAQVLDQGGYDTEILFVNDGSTDGSAGILKQLSGLDSRVRVLNFSRNFGHEAAMIAGLDHAGGDVVICLDADLQHPPAMIPEMLGRYRDGYEIVSMVRRDTAGGSFLQNLRSKLFYRLLNWISPEEFTVNATDFFLVSKRVRIILSTRFRERARFLRGFIQVVGFRRTSIEFLAPERAGGTSKYNVFSLLTFSFSAVAAFSKLPLRLGIILGGGFGLLSLAVGIYSIAMKLLGFVVPGYTTIVVLISFFFAIQFLLLGLIGEYIGYLFDEMKKRPIYLLDSVVESGETSEA